MKKDLFPLLLLILVVCTQIGAQQDSTFLKPEIVQFTDLKPRQLIENETYSSIATGKNIELSRTPQTIYIITAKDILRQNISTLTDVMRTIPGAVVSSAGNAHEGEKFMIMGLSGNAHLKIMINDVPVKPYSAVGMPIGAQLPIRQADRIEIMLGGASSFYGEEACAGVVNIILRESERPVFTRTNLGFGRLGYSDFDLTFGGKLGKDKNTFRYTLYGRSTEQNNRNNYYNKEQNYQFRDYLLYSNQEDLWSRNPNLVNEKVDTNEIATIFGAPQESRQFGAMLVWRGLRIRYDQMSRREHSSLGLNPLAVAYFRPGDRIGERIETLSIRLGRKRRRRESSLIMSGLLYSTTSSSLKTHVFGAMGQTFYQELRRDTIVGYNRILADEIFKIYYEGQRNVVNQGLDLRTQYRFSVQFKRNFTYSTGLLVHLHVGRQYSELTNKPLFWKGAIPDISDTITNIKPWTPPSTTNLLTSLYQQLMYTSKHITLLGGVTSHFTLEDTTFFTKRFSGLWRINRYITATANYGEGYTPPSPYYYGNTVLVDTDMSTTAQTSAQNSQNALQSQRSITTDFGLRGRYQLIVAAITYFGMQQTNTIEGGYYERDSGKYEIPDAIEGTYVLYGYRSDGGASTRLRGTQFTIGHDHWVIPFRRGKKGSKWTWANQASLQWSKGLRVGLANQMGQRVTLNYIPNYANRHFIWVSTLTNTKLEITTRLNSASSTQSNLDLYKERFLGLDRATNQLGDRRTLDITVRLFVNKNFSTWIDIRNLGNSKWNGIDATSTPDDLRFNQQPLRTLRFGVQYNLD
jgi:TonB-dependent Receptor Plug Domain